MLNSATVVMHQTHTRAGIHTHTHMRQLPRWRLTQTRNYARGLQKDGDFLDNVRDY